MLTGSPKKKNLGFDQFVNKCSIDDLTIKQIAVVKTSTAARAKAITGSNPVNPLSPDQLQEQMRASMNASPARRARVEGYMHSNGMREAIN